MEQKSCVWDIILVVWIVAIVCFRVHTVCRIIGLGEELMACEMLGFITCQEDFNFIINHMMLWGLKKSDQHFFV